MVAASEMREIIHNHRMAYDSSYDPKSYNEESSERDEDYNDEPGIIVDDM